jgi:hypothetical protein
MPETWLYGVYHHCITNLSFVYLLSQDGLPDEGSLGDGAGTPDGLGESTPEPVRSLELHRTAVELQFGE